LWARKRLKLSKSILFLRSVLFNLFIRIVTHLLYVLFAPLLFIGRKGALIGCVGWAYSVVYSAKYIAGIDFEVRGKIPEGAAIFACKHQSAWETAIFYVITKRPVYIYKKELLWLPFFNLFMVISGNIMVDRQAGASTLKNLVRKAKIRLSEGRPLVLFPEGTRKAFGAAPDYKPGIAALYNATDADVIPIALNSGKFWGRNEFLKKPGKIIVHFLPPIEKGLSKKEFMHRLETTIESACAEL